MDCTLKMLRLQVAVSRLKIAAMVPSKWDEAALKISRLFLILKAAAFDRSIFKCTIQMFPRAHVLMSTTSVRRP